MASGLAVPFFGVFVLRDRGLGYAFLASYAGLGAVARMVAAPVWGRGVDRPGGARRVILAANAVAVSGPLLWIASARLGPAVLLVDAVAGGVATAGASVACLVFPLSISDDATRPVYHAVFAVAGGLAFGAGTAVAAALAGRAPGWTFAGPLTLPFALCAVVRVAAVALSARVADARA